MSKQILTPEMEYIVKILEKLVNIPSPSGFTKEIMETIEKEAKRFGFSSFYSKKGGLIIEVPAACGCEEKETLGLTAHGDTLGAMVRSISSQGTLRFVSVGGYMMESIEELTARSTPVPERPIPEPFLPQRLPYTPMTMPEPWKES